MSHTIYVFANSGIGNEHCEGCVWAFSITLAVVVETAFASLVASW